MENYALDVEVKDQISPKYNHFFMHST